MIEYNKYLEKPSDEHFQKLFLIVFKDMDIVNKLIEDILKNYSSLLKQGFIDKHLGLLFLNKKRFIEATHYYLQALDNEPGIFLVYRQLLIIAGQRSDLRISNFCIQKMKENSLPEITILIAKLIDCLILNDPKNIKTYAYLLIELDLPDIAAKAVFDAGIRLQDITLLHFSLTHKYSKFVLDSIPEHIKKDMHLSFMKQITYILKVHYNI